MTETQPEIPQDPPPPEETTPEPTGLTEAERAAARPGKPDPVDAPDDVDADAAKGYAVYDRTLGRFVGGVTADKPSASDARKLVAEGHSHKVVRV